MMATLFCEGIVREEVLRDLASLAAKDREFLTRARKDPEGTLARHGYHLIGEEMQLVKDFQRRTAGMSDEELARTLANGLERRIDSPAARPAVPRWRGVRPARPARPGR